MLYVFMDMCITRLILRTAGKNCVKVYVDLYHSVGLYYTQTKAATKIRNAIPKCHLSLLNYCP